MTGGAGVDIVGGGFLGFGVLGFVGGGMVVMELGLRHLGGRGV